MVVVGGEPPFRGGAIKAGSSGWLLRVKTSSTNKEETKERLQPKYTSHSDSAVASGSKCGQPMALGRHNCASAGRRQGRAVQGTSLTG